MHKSTGFVGAVCAIALTTRHLRQLERDDYDRALLDYFLPYHVLADLMCRVAINHDLLSEPLVTLSALLGIEAVPLHLAHFTKLWIDVHQTKVGEPAPGRETVTV